MCFRLEQFFPAEKRVKPCVVRSSFSAALLQQEKWRPDNLFFGVYFYRKVFLLIRFRGQFSGEIFINLS